MPDATLRIQLIPHAFPLNVTPALTGEGMMTLATPDGMVRMTVPLAAWPWLTPGEQISGSLTLFRVAMDAPTPEPLGLARPGLIIPGGEN